MSDPANPANIRPCGDGDAAATLAVFTEAERRGYRVLTVHGSRTARLFFERSSFTVVEELTVDINGVALTTFAMRRPGPTG